MLADELGVSRTAIGGLCRRQGWTRTGKAWDLTADQVAFVRAHFAEYVAGARTTSCRVDACGGAVLARGFCRTHYRRAARYGDPLAQGRGGAELNAAKTHCPKNHAYTPENTAIWGGRRRCLTCSRERRASQA